MVDIERDSSESGQNPGERERAGSIPAVVDTQADQGGATVRVQDQPVEATSVVPMVLDQTSTPLNNSNRVLKCDGWILKREYAHASDLGRRPLGVVALRMHSAKHAIFDIVSGTRIRNVSSMSCWAINWIVMVMTSNCSQQSPK
jgi:hypothetical protein